MVFDESLVWSFTFSAYDASTLQFLDVSIYCRAVRSHVIKTFEMHFRDENTATKMVCTEESDKTQSMKVELF